MPSAWRIVRAARVNSAFTGEGARVYGGRWNSRGTGVIYVSQHESLAALELLVHLTPLSPSDRYLSFRLEWEDKLTDHFPLKSLPPRWNAGPPVLETMQIGDEWVRGGNSVALAVPSVLSASEMNFLLNPKHADFKKIKISKPVEYRFDSRLLNHQ
jgi:RES domain-containing protein